MSFDGIEKLNKIIEEKDQEIKRLTALLESEKSSSNRALQELQYFYEEILALMPGHVYWLDKNNVFLGCNDLQAKNALLQSRKDIVGKTNYEMPWKDQADELNRLNNLVMETGAPHTAEEYAVMAQGMTIYLSNKTPIRDKDNNVIGVLGLSVDITEQKKMEAALRRAKENAEIANNAKTEFITNTSHDIRPPLRGIIEISRVMSEHAHNKEDQNYAQWIYQSCKQLLSLLDGVLRSISADNTNDSDVRKEPTRLRDNMQDLVHLVFPMLKIKNIDLKVHVDETIPETVIADRIKLDRILLYLLGNTINASQNGTISITIEMLSHDSGYAQIRFAIIDTNRVIPDEMQAIIFDSNPQVNLLTNDNDEDINLSIAQRYVGILGGEIKLDSEPKTGTTFSFVLSIKMGNQV